MVVSALPSGVRPASQAGRFYPAAAAELARTVDAYLNLQNQPSPVPPHPLRMVVAPHAGYLYSGPVAGAAFAALAGQACSHILLLGPTHHFDFTGLALSSAEHFATPLGLVRVDQASVSELAASGGPFTVDDEAHHPEHALEVELPFLQRVLPQAQIMPGLLGRVTPDQVRAIALPIATLLQQRTAAGERWVTVISTDTYHGEDGTACEANDERLMDLLAQRDAQAWLAAVRRREVMACGWAALAVGLAVLAAQPPPAQVVWRARADSRRGDRTSRGYVVGYVGGYFF